MKNKATKNTSTETKFDANSAADPSAGIYGIHETSESAKIHLIPVPWDVTTSYRPGTSRGPEAIYDASMQVDLYDRDLGVSYISGIYMYPLSPEIKKLNQVMRSKAETVIDAGGVITAKNKKNLDAVNDACEKLNKFVYESALASLKKGKRIGIIGGDHAVPYGAIKALGKAKGSFGILHFDAHADLRNAYEGFKFSHASIMYNVLKDFPFVTQLVQVGVRDFCEEEMDLIKASKKRVTTFFDSDLARSLLEAKPWSQTCKEIVSPLPKKVYVSFDIDGLEPAFCPHTGTPVPGGLTMQQVLMVIQEIRKQKKEIIGFDLVEVSPNLKDKTDEWDANVAARLLYKMCGMVLS